jgi:hypothetical protein
MCFLVGDARILLKVRVGVGPVSLTLVVDYPAIGALTLVVDRPDLGP